MKNKISKNTEKEFRLASWAIENKTTIYVLITMFFILGLSAYYGMPRESFPEIKETKIYISTIYPGNTAEDIERLVIDPLEEELKNVSSVVEILSTSKEDYGIITVEFDEDITVEAAKQKVKDEVDTQTASEDWPIFNNAKVEPDVFDLNMSEEFPILNVNLKGDYPIEQLKEFGEYLQDEIESIQEIKQVDIRGAQEKEVEVAVDIYKMMAAQVSFDDILNAIRRGNVTTSAGNMITSGQRRTIRIIGEIEDPKHLENFVVKSQNGSVYLRDLAKIRFKEEDKTTYAREFGEAVVMLDVKKRSGKNMVEAAEKVRAVLKKAQNNYFPPDLEVTIANDQSDQTLSQVDDLVNNIIFGVILVVWVLMFFLGFRNALFVGFAIPMSMFMSFMILNAMGYTMNTMILFGLIMGLGMLVDNGIVVVENVYRLMDEEGISRREAAKRGIGEIAFPIIISTATTVAAFIPLGMWPGVMGEFMKYFPITLSVVLGSSLFVAIFMNSVLVSQFMSIDEKRLSRKQLISLSIFLGVPGLLIILFGGSVRGLGTIMLVTIVTFWLYRYGLKDAGDYFQRNILSWIENKYQSILKNTLNGWKPIIYTISTFALLILVFTLFFQSVGSGRTKVEFFPDNTPKQIITYIEYPEGTDIEKTNQVAKKIEKIIYKEINNGNYIEDGYNFLVESAVSQVGEGAGNPQTDGGSAAEMPNKAKITTTMREFKLRKDRNSEELRQRIQKALEGIFPGVAVSVEKDAVGPPVGYPINIELSGNDYDELIVVAEKMREFINTKSIAGIQELKIDVNKAKPTMLVEVDREKAGELNISTGQVGNQLRRSVFGEKAGIYKEGGDDYDIYVRFDKDNRYNVSSLFEQNVTFRDQETGRIKEIPISAVTKRRNTASFSAIKHRDVKKVVTVYSALAPGYTDATAIVRKIEKEMKNFDKPTTVEIDYTGQIEEQNNQMMFLMGAFFAGLGMIMLLLIYQFNSITKPTIIMIAIFLSFIGVFGGIMITGWPFVIMMTMMGIISLAGIVVNNGVVLLDYAQLLIDRRKIKLELTDHDLLPKEHMKDVLVISGRARLRPVLLTAITTILGLIPLAIGLNINFFTMFSEFDAQIYIGGDNVIFWGPLAWAVIFGLVVATFLTLVIVPTLFYISYRVRLWFFERKNNKNATIQTN